MNTAPARPHLSSAANPAKLGDERQTDLQRLAVVLLDVDQEALLAGRILEVARNRQMQVLLIGVAKNSETADELHRKLITIAAFLRSEGASNGIRYAGSGPNDPIQIRMELGRDWLGAIQALVRPTDLLACYAEQTIGAQGASLADLLSSKLNLPLYAFSGLEMEPHGKTNLLAEAMPWLASIATIAGFLLLQVRIVVDLQGWLQSTGLLLTVAAETGLIWLVNSLFSAF